MRSGADTVTATVDDGREITLGLALSPGERSVLAAGGLLAHVRAGGRPRRDLPRPRSNPLPAPLTPPRTPKEIDVAEHIYRIAEIVGTSPDGVDDAIRNAVTRANQTLRNMDWFEMTEVRGHLADGQVADWQVTVKIGFRLEERGVAPGGGSATDADRGGPHWSESRIACNL